MIMILSKRTVFVTSMKTVTFKRSTRSLIGMAGQEERSNSYGTLNI